MAFGFIKKIAVATATSALLASAGFAQDGEFARFAQHAEEGGPTIDYSAWTTILEGVVFDVGYSDRRAPSARQQSVTGTLINPASPSRYRNEGNRVLLHLIEDVHADAISAYRQELEAIPDQVPLAELNSNEQLAYWLNLHNAVLIDELVKQYPVRNIDRARVDGQPLLDAKLLEIEGVALSLNDIRYNIVAEGWQDPRVIYGFFIGSVGGPSLRDEAFEARRVWSQLESNAREFVNGLRGVDTGFRRTELSPYYQMHADLFPGGVDELKTHLMVYADDEVDALISEIDGSPAYLDFDWRIADLTNGRNGCSGAQASQNVDIIGPNGRTNNAISCNVLPPQALELFEVVIQRRLEYLRSGRIGRVTLRDIPTDPDQDEEAETSSSGITVNLPTPEQDPDSE
jgi:hypothetical protein